MRYVRYLVLLIFALPVSGFATDSTPASKALKSNYDNEEGFARPGLTVRLPEEDDEEKNPAVRWQAVIDALKPRVEKKKQLNEASDLRLITRVAILFSTVDTKSHFKWWDWVQ